jgi:hypothetical protein
MQVDLFGNTIEKPKILPSLPYGDNTESFDELENRVAKGYGRRHIGFPCDVAQDMQLDDRPKHIEDCPECQELIKKLDVIAYGNKSN